MNFGGACALSGYNKYKQGDVEEGLEKLHHSDELGYTEGTGMLGLVYIKMGKVKEGITYLKKACKAGDKPSCQDAKDFDKTSTKNKGK